MSAYDLDDKQQAEHERLRAGNQGADAPEPALYASPPFPDAKTRLTCSGCKMEVWLRSRHVEAVPCQLAAPKKIPIARGQLWAHLRCPFCQTGRLRVASSQEP